MNNQELVSIIRSHRNNALGFIDGELSNERGGALDHYYGRPYGNEQEGFSQVVTRDLSETIDWAMPAILRIFLQSGNIAEFVPVSENDEDQARQESDYINHAIMKDNNGFLVLHDCFKDALLLKNGYVKHYWEEIEKISEPEYEGLTDDEFTQIFQDLSEDGEVDIKGHDQREIMTELGPMAVHDVQFKVKRTIERLRLDPVPPEELRVSKKCRGSLQDSPYVEHQTTKTRSELIEMGIDKDFVSRLSAYNEDDNTDSETNARDSVEDESDDLAGLSFDRSMDDIEYCECYILVDWDGDGIAERRKVVLTANEIPPGDDWNEPVDMVYITGFVPKRVPHRHVGESLDDEIKDLQEIKTTLFRQMLDNVFATNNQQWIVNRRVHLPDFLKSVPGGVKRVDDDQPVNGAYEPVQTTPILNQILPVIDFVDNLKENRTGINNTTTGLDPDVLKEATKGAYMENLNKASQKVEMLARMLAETGAKELILRCREIVAKHQTKARTIKLRGKYVSINPQGWRDRTDVTVKVGIGTGSEEERRQKLAIMASLQDKLREFGLVGPQHAFALFEDMAKALNFDTPEKYGFQPESEEYQQYMEQQSQQEQPNPLAEAEQVKGQFALQGKQMEVEFKGQIEQLKRDYEAQIAMIKVQTEMSQKEADRLSKETIEAAKLEVQAMIEGYKIDVGAAGMGTGLQD